MLLYPISTVDHVDLSVSKIRENCLYLGRKIEQEEEKIQKEIKAGDFHGVPSQDHVRTYRTNGFSFLGSSFFVVSFRFLEVMGNSPPSFVLLFFLIPKIRGMSLQNCEKSIGILAKVLYQSDLVNPAKSVPKTEPLQGAQLVPHIYLHIQGK